MHIPPLADFPKALYIHDAHFREDALYLNCNDRCELYRNVAIKRVSRLHKIQEHSNRNIRHLRIVFARVEFP